MAGKAVHVIDQLHLTRAGAGAADTSLKRDQKTAMTALIGADFQKVWGDHAVKPGPIKAAVRMVQFAGQGGHQGNRVIFALNECGNGFGQ